MPLERGLDQVWEPTSLRVTVILLQEWKPAHGNFQGWRTYWPNFLAPGSHQIKIWRRWLDYDILRWSKRVNCWRGQTYFYPIRFPRRWPQKRGQTPQVPHSGGLRRTGARPDYKNVPKFKPKNNRARAITRRPQVATNGTKGTVVWAQPLYSSTQQRPPETRNDFPQESVCQLSPSPQKAKPKASRKRLVLLPLLSNTEENSQGSPDTFRFYACLWCDGRDANNKACKKVRRAY